MKSERWGMILDEFDSHFFETLFIYFFLKEILVEKYTSLRTVFPVISSREMLSASALPRQRYFRCFKFSRLSFLVGYVSHC